MKQIELTTLCSLNMGQSPESSTYNEAGKGLPFFQGNADFGETHPQTRVWCSAPTKIANAGDILISVRAPIGAMNIATERCCIGRGLAALTPYEDKCDRQYLYYAIQSRVEELIAQGTGSTFKAIGKKVLESLLIPSYSLDEQAEIVAKLKKIDSVISNQREQQKLLGMLVRSRFIEMFGTETEFDKWVNVTVEDVADVCVGVVIKPTQYYTSKGIPAFRSLNIGEMYVKDAEWVYFTEEGHQKNQKSVIRENDVLIVRSGAPGTACVATKKYAGYNAVDIIIAHPNPAKINSIFLAAFTNMPHGMNQIKEKTGGAAQQHFNVGGYKAMKLILPPLNLQKQFAAFVQATDKSKLYSSLSLKCCQLTANLCKRGGQYVEL